MTLEKRCPRCQQPMSIDARSGYWVSACGYKVPESLDEAQARMNARGKRPVMSITYGGTVEARALSLYESAHDHLWQNRPADAIRDFQRTLELQPEFTDPYLWLAKLSPDETVKRGYLEEVLARDPGNLEALRAVMVMNGELTAEEAERSLQPNSPQPVAVADPVKASTQSLNCPVCGGSLTTDASGRVICNYCGYVAPVKKTRTVESGGVVGVALLKRRGQAVQWVIGKRLLHCNQCGAERTVPATDYSSICPFCGTNAVIKQDALTTIDKPDLLIPFVLTEAQAAAAIRERLTYADQKLARLFNENRVQHMDLQNVFVPFWVFDALVMVSQTRTDHRTPTSRDQIRTFKPYDTTQFQDGVVGLTIAALTVPPLLTQIEAFSLSDAVAYDARRLAAAPAALYDIPVDAASLTARSTISTLLRARYEQPQEKDVKISVFVNVIQMTFTLLLAPVWIATLTERDGDQRTVLVNGQTGKVTLGKAQRAT